MDRLAKERRPLVLLLLVACVHAVTWAVLLPPFQAPDEGGHYTYAETLVEQRTIPWSALSGERSGERRATSTAFEIAGRWSGFEPLRGNTAARPFWTSLDERLWREQAERLPADARRDAGFTSSFENPPLYYLYVAVPYTVGLLGDLFDRAWLMRLANVPLLLLVVALTWRLARRLLGTDPLPRVVATAFVALQPMLGQLGGAMSPDVLLTALSTLVLLLAVVVVQDGLTPQRAFALAAGIAGAALSQPRGLALAVPALVAIALAAHRRRGLTRRWAVGGAAAGALLAAAISVLMVGPTAERVREFASYVWQFYLPRLPSMQSTIGRDDYGVREVAVDRLWGAFAQLEVGLPPVLSDLLWVTTLALAIGLLAVGIGRAGRIRRQWRVATVLGTAVLSTALLLHLVAFRAMRDVPDDPVIAGRYLLPLLPPAGVALGWLLVSLPARARPPAAGVAVAALVALQLTALGLTFERFYA